MNLQPAQAIPIVDDDSTITDTFARLLQSVLFKPLWLDDHLALARGVTEPA